ncbi:MAG TPA: PP2C family serine/threonine-protein phosphatase [Longimicrobium sp.]|nr:PP2C family serine/threonine-protein phosphatase [Longimicrobium sp.]
MKVTWEAAGATDVGRVRAHNEDSFVIDAQRGVFLVADGMGGHAAGEVASAIASEAVGSALRQAIDAGLDADGVATLLAETFHGAHRSIVNYSLAKPETRGMGTTLTALVVFEDGGFRLGHIGDSRCYVLRDGELTQLSRDHTWVQREVDAGRLTDRGARRHHLSHVLTRALGADSLDVPDVYAGTLLPGDLVLLCSDGLTGMLTDRMIRRILVRGGELAKRVAELVLEANDRGGRDNITAVLVRISDTE